MEFTKRQTIELEHQLQVRRIWLEKALIGAIIVVIGLIAHAMIENHKSDLADKSFLLKSRVEALLKMRRSYADLSDHMHFAVFDKKGGLSERRDQYEKDLIAFVKHANEHAFLFPRRFDESVNHHVWIHQATIEQEKTPIKREHWGFAVEVFHHFDELTRQTLDDIESDKAIAAPRSRFRFDPAKSKDPADNFALAFLRANLGKWERHRSSQGKIP